MMEMGAFQPDWGTDMAEIVNLKDFRKGRARAEADAAERRGAGTLWAAGPVAWDAVSAGTVTQPEGIHSSIPILSTAPLARKAPMCLHPFYTPLSLASRHCSGVSASTRLTGWSLIRERTSAR